HRVVTRVLGLCRYSCGFCDGGRTLLELAVSRLPADSHTHGTRQLLSRRGLVRRESLSRWEAAMQSSLIISTYSQIGYAPHVRQNVASSCTSYWHCGHVLPSVDGLSPKVSRKIS